MAIDPASLQPITRTDQPVMPRRAPRDAFQMVTSRGFVDWMVAGRVSLALTTYQVGGLIFLGIKPPRELGMYAAAFDRAMGLWTDGQTVWLATAMALWRMENCLAEGKAKDGFDRVFVPRMSYTTGDLDIHDLVIESNGRPVFVNTRFGCLATVDERYNFAPLWKPPFLSGLVPEDRCHLNGLAAEDGKAKYATMVARCDVADGWRDNREAGGLVMDVTSDEIVAEGLSMPHSPRVHDGKLWLVNAGTGYFGYVDRKSGKFEAVTFVPGYARGLSFHGGYAIIGTSKPRREHAFRDLPLQKNLDEKGASPRCGLQVIEVATGAVAHWLRIEGRIEELFDVAVLPGVVRPKAMSFATPAIGHHFCYADGDRVEHWSPMSE